MALVSSIATVNITERGGTDFALLPGMVERRCTGIVATPGAMVGADAYAVSKAALEAYAGPGSVDMPMHAWIRDQDPDAVGRRLRDRFTERPATGDLIAPEAYLPGALAGHFGVVLLYRGGWCGYRVAQLRAFRRAADRLADLDIRVVALSVDDETTTRRTIAEHRLDFPVGHSADADAVAAATGAFVNDAPRYLQSTGFVLDREGRVMVSVYSSGAIGRLVPNDVIGLIEYVRGREAQEEAT